MTTIPQINPISKPVASSIRITPDLLRKYDRPGPRYTSYPTAVEFNPAYDASAYFESLHDAAMRPDDPLSLYLHLPFCEHRCTFCGCNVVITQHRAVSEKYLGYLHREVREVARRLGRRRKVVQYHWGGGTPTYLKIDEILALQHVVTECFEIMPDAEAAIEVDPRVTSREQIGLLRSIGFNRLSMGVQDFDPEVQAIINRNQTERQTRELFAYSRSVGFASINIDLIYGLPLQKPETFAKTLDTVIELRADRVAVYSYAHVPWLRTQQKGFDPALLPSPEQKLDLFCLAREAFLQAGYRQIGMDHFSLPEDELAKAVETRTLSRNFMGYTVKAAPDMVGLGVSAIGDVSGSYAQNQKKLPRYYDAIDKGSLPIERGYRLSADDQIRRFVITQLMCNFHLDMRAVEERFGVVFDHVFERELLELASPGGLIANGFVTVSREAVHVEPLGHLFVRNVAMLFDRYLLDKKADSPIFSRTV